MLCIKQELFKENEPLFRLVLNHSTGSFNNFPQEVIILVEEKQELLEEFSI